MCGSPCLCVCVCVRVCVVWCRTKADTHQQGWRAHNTFGAGKRVRLSSSLMLAEEPNGDHMPESAEESFCVINTKSLGVPHCQGLRYSLTVPNRGSVEANEISLRHRKQPATGEGTQRIKQSKSQAKSCITLLITNSVGLLHPPSLPPYCCPSLTSVPSLSPSFELRRLP